MDRLKKQDGSKGVEYKPIECQSTDKPLTSLCDISLRRRYLYMAFKPSVTQKLGYQLLPKQHSVHPGSGKGSILVNSHGSKDIMGSNGTY